MMYHVEFIGEAVIHADDEEQAKDYLMEDVQIPMGQISITKIKELD